MYACMHAYIHTYIHMYADMFGKPGIGGEQTLNQIRKRCQRATPERKNSSQLATSWSNLPEPKGGKMDCLPILADCHQSIHRDLRIHDKDGCTCPLVRSRVLR